MATTVDNIGGEIFQIASNRETSVEELAQHLSSVLDQLNVARPRIVNGSPHVGDVKEITLTQEKQAQQLAATN